MLETTPTIPTGYTRCRPPLPVIVRHEDGSHPGFAVAYSGRRITVEFGVAPGMNHLMVVDADMVAQRCGLAPSLPWSGHDEAAPSGAGGAASEGATGVEG